jgi:hypothetical protein
MAIKFSLIDHGQHPRSSMRHVAISQDVRPSPGLVSPPTPPLHPENGDVPHVLAELPYSLDALTPHMSAETLEFHHGKHHAAYVAKLNELLAGHAWADLPLTDLIRTAHATPGAEAIFNNAAQHWNHAQFWNGVRPKGGGAIPGELERWSRHSAASRPSGLIS